MKTEHVSSTHISNMAKINKTLYQKSTQVVGQTCSTGGAMKRAGGGFPYHFIRSKMSCSYSLHSKIKIILESNARTFIEDFNNDRASMLS